MTAIADLTACTHLLTHHINETSIPSLTLIIVLHCIRISTKTSVWPNSDCDFSFITRTSRMWYYTWQIHDAIITSLWNQSTIMTLLRHVSAEYVLVDLNPDKAMINAVFITIEITIQETRCIWWIKCILQNVYIYIYFFFFQNGQQQSCTRRGSREACHQRLRGICGRRHSVGGSTIHVCGRGQRGACPLREPLHPREGRGRPG